jgi:hypothetical protein
VVPTLPSSEALFAYLEASIRRIVSQEDGPFGPVGSRGRALAWNWSYWGRAMVFAYRATREPRFLDLFVESFALILEQRDDRLGLVDAAKGRVVPGWGSAVGGAHLNEITVAGMVTLPLCEFLLLARDDGEVSARFGQLLPSYYAIAEEVVWQFEDDYRATPAGGHYLFPVARIPEPINHQHALAAAFVHLLALTGRPQYRARVDEIGRSFRSSVTLEKNGAWSWPYVPTTRDILPRDAEAVWKAGTTIEFPVAALRHGLAFRADAGRLSNTLLLNVLRTEGINQWVTSTRTSLLGGRHRGSSLPGAAIAVWFLMPDPYGRHRVALLERMDRQPELFRGEWLGGARAMAMAAAWLMRSLPRGTATGA